MLIKRLASLANKLDEIGLTKEADLVDLLIKQAIEEYNRTKNTKDNMDEEDTNQ